MTKVAVLPGFGDLLDQIIVDAGAERADAAEADAIVWTDPRDPDALGEVLLKSPARWVQLPFTGIEAFFAAGVIDPARTWTCTKGAYSHATAEQALALMLAGARMLPRYAKAKTWEQLGTERRLAGSTVVLVGTGGIGTELAAMLAPLKVDIIAVNRSGRAFAPAIETVAFTRLKSVIGRADQVVLAAPLTEQTQDLLNGPMIGAMKDGAWLVNVARGGLVDTEALVEALQAGKLSGAGLDVTEPEPLPDGHPLWDMDNVIITSHTGNTVAMAIPELLAQVERNLRHFVAGETLEGLVDPALGY